MNVLPPRGTKLGSDLLWSLRALTEVKIPDGAQTIGKEWFARCGVITLTVPASVTSIEEGAFSGCKALTQVSFAEGS